MSEFFDDVDWHHVRQVAARLVRFALLGLTAGVAVVIVVSLVALAALQFAPVRSMVSDYAVAQLESGDGLTIEIDGYGGLWPVRLKVDTLRVRDGGELLAQARGVDVSWRPLALLSGHVHLTRVDVQHLSLHALQNANSNAAPADTDPAGALSGPAGPLIPQLPVAVSIDQISVPDIILAPDVAGADAVSLQLEGAGRLVGADAGMSVRARRTDGGRFSADIDLTYQPEQGVFEFDIAVEDGKGKTSPLIAELTGDPALKTVHLAARGGGPKDKWQGHLKGELGTYGSLTLEADGSRVEGETLTLAGMVAPGIGAGGGPGTPAASDVSFGGRLVRHENDYTIEDTKLEAGALTFAGQLGFQSLLEAPVLSVSGNLAGLAGVLGISAPPLVEVDVDASADPGFSAFEISTATLSAPGQSLSFTGAIDRRQGAMSGVVDVDMASISGVVGTGAGGGVDGALKLRADIAKALFSGAITGRLDARFAPLEFGTPNLSHLLGDVVTLSANAVGDDEGRTQISSLSLTPSSAAFDLTASGFVSPGENDLTVQVAVPDLVALGASAGVDMAGHAHGDVRVFGEASSLDVDAQLNLAGGRVADVPVEGKASARVSLADNVSGTASFVGIAGGEAATASATFVREGAATQLSELSASLLGIVLSGQLGVDGAGAINADIKGDVSSLAPLGQLAGAPLGGHGRFLVVATPTDAGVVADVDAQLFSLRAADVRAGATRVRAKIDEAGHAALTATLRNVRAGSRSIGKTKLDLSGPLNAAKISARFMDISLLEDAVGDSHLAVSAMYDTALSNALVSDLQGEVAGTKLALRKPVKVSWSPELHVPDVALDIGEGALTASLRFPNNGVDASLGLQALPLSLVAALAGEDREVLGSVDGTASLSGRGNRGSADFDFTMAPRVPAAGTDIPVLKLGGTWDGRQLAAELFADMPGADDLRATAKMSVTARNGFPYLASKAHVDAKLLGTLDVGAVWPLVPVDGHQMSGSMDVDVSATGPLSDLAVAGSAHMENGLYEGYDTGLVLSPLVLKMDATRDGGRLAVSGKDGGAGNLTGSGTLDLSVGADKRLDVSLELSSFKVARRDDVSATASGDIAMLWPRGPEGQLQPLSIEGAITVNQLDAHIPDQLASEVETIDVTRVTSSGEPIDADVEQSATPAGSSTETMVPSAMVLNVDVTVPRQAFVRGRGLESEWQGSVKVSGDVDTPTLLGTFEVVRGSFDFLSKEFDLAGGKIEFTGGREIDPLLDVKAVYKNDDFQAIVAVTGQSSNPEIALTSIPALPQDEIISRILFGTGTGQLTALQAVQLASAAASLTGTASTGGVLDAMRKALGVDVLSIGQSGLEVGSYVRDGVYVGVAQGLDAGSGQVTVEVELTDSVSVESDVDTTGDTSVGVTWERDY